ncbi:hypothetical protein OAA91_01930 [Fibrobacterales bacterium]|nr:hypothetical protein [Fibrobacterales bacterium]
MKKVILILITSWITSCGGPDLESAVKLAEQMKRIYKEGDCTQYRKIIFSDIEAICDSSLTIDSSFVKLFKNSPFSIVSISTVGERNFQFIFHSGAGSEEYIMDKSPGKFSSNRYTQIDSTGWWHFKY